MTDIQREQWKYSTKIENQRVICVNAGCKINIELIDFV